MKRLLKWMLRLLLALVLLLGLALLLKDSILRRVFEQRLRSETGMDVRVKKFSSRLFAPVVTVGDLKLYNTAEFGGAPFLDIPELHVELDSAGLRQGKLHVTLLRFHLNEIDVVRNELGQTNVLNLFRKVQSSVTGKDRKQRLLGKLEFTGIDVLDLTVSKAKYIDLKDSRNNRETKVNLQNQVFKNVKSEGDLYGVLFMIWLRSGGQLSLTPTANFRDPALEKEAVRFSP